MFVTYRKLFLTTYRKNRPKGNELEFFSYLFIFKLWHHICSSNEERKDIERLIPLLYKFDTSLSSFVISKKYITHSYYDNGSYIIKNIKDRILKMLKTDERANESSKQIESLSNTPYFHQFSPYRVRISWLSKLTDNPGDILVENSNDSDNFIEKTLVPRISDITTIRVSSPEMFYRNISDITTLYVSSNRLSSNNIEENISDVSTVHLHYPENDEDRHKDGCVETTLSVFNLDSLLAECPSTSSYHTASTDEPLQSSVSDAYMTCPSSEDFIIDKIKSIKSSQQNEVTMKIKSASSSPRSLKLPKLSNGSSHIRILERKDYIKRGNSRNRTFSMFRDERLTSKQNVLKRSNNSLDDGRKWKEIKQCSVKVKRLDSLEIEAFKNKKLPLEYFSRTYSNKSNNDEQISENSIDLNDSNISIEILEETLGSRAYLYCRDVQKTLENETRNVRKRAKSCFNC